MGSKNRIIIALDGMREKEALRIAKLLQGQVWGFKINDLLFGNIAIIGRLKKFGHVFADAKLHDIPNTVANSVTKLSRAGADLITVHAIGGVKMMKAAKQNAGKSKILAVSILTSMGTNSKEVLKLTQDTLKANMDGIVCSGQDLLLIKNIPESKALLKIVPGIRSKWYKNRDDQKRTMSPEKAIQEGADYLVIGRPIINSKNPLKALTSI